MREVTRTPHIVRRRRWQPLFYLCPLVFVMAQAACVDDWILDYTRSKPNEADMVGTWLPTKETLDLMASYGHYDTAHSATKIVLLADHRFRFQDMPDWWTLSESHRNLQSATGTWTLTPNVNERGWAISATILSGVGSVDFNLRKQKPPYIVHFLVAEDSAMEFERQE